MRTPSLSPAARKRSLSVATGAFEFVASAMMTMANFPCTTVWLMSAMLKPDSARICATPATMPG
jgi:hypothetical protein